MENHKRSEAREEVFRLLFESEFQGDKTPEEILNLAEENREFGADAYIRKTFFEVTEKKAGLDEWINRHSNGWKTERIAPVLRSILRLATYEMLYRKDVPAAVAMNEAIELTKKFGEEKEKAFVNGILNGIKVEVEGKQS